MSIEPDKLLQHMAVPGTVGLYVLGCFEARITLYSQQVRALNLVYALFARGLLKEGQHLVVVGAGAGGLTAAAAAATKGCQVTVLEQARHPMAPFHESTGRYVHPHIYDWPHESWEQAEAGLPLLDWTAASAHDVREQILRGWDEVRGAHPGRITLIPALADVMLDDTSKIAPWLVRWPTPFNQLEADVVLLAVGFGPERHWPEVETPSYWKLEGLQQYEPTGSETRYLISGCGDGGLIDLLRARVENLRHETIIQDLLPDTEPTLVAVRERLLEIENDNRSDDDAWLTKQYLALKTPAITERMKLRRDRVVELNGEGRSPFSKRASILSRFLASRLFESGQAYRPGRIASVQKADGGFRVLIEGVTHAYHHLILRWGPEPALEKGFRTLWARCQQTLQVKNQLDQTREPIWDDAFYGKARRPRGHRTRQSPPPAGSGTERTPPDAGLPLARRSPPVPSPAIAASAVAFRDAPFDLGTIWGLDRGGFLGVLVGPRGETALDPLVHAERLLWDLSPEEPPGLPTRWWLSIDPLHQPNGPGSEADAWAAVIDDDPRVERLRSRGLADGVILGFHWAIPLEDVNERTLLSIETWGAALRRIFAGKQPAIVLTATTQGGRVEWASVERLRGRLAVACGAPHDAVTVLSLPRLDAEIAEDRREEIRVGAQRGGVEGRRALLSALGAGSDAGMDAWVEGATHEPRFALVPEDLVGDPERGSLIEGVALALMRRRCEGADRASRVDRLLSGIRPMLGGALRLVLELCSGGVSEGDFIARGSAEAYFLALRAGLRIDVDAAVLGRATLDDSKLWWLLTAMPPIRDRLARILALDPARRAVFGLITPRERAAIRGDAALVSKLSDCRRGVAVADAG
jgi:hypothetical protein